MSSSSSEFYMAGLSGFGDGSVLEGARASGLADIQFVLVPSPAWS